MTVRQVSFHPDAIEEAVATARWYRQRSARAAERFVDELPEAVDRITDAPQRWPLGPRGTHKVKLPCFPILVIYREAGSVARTRSGRPRLVQRAESAEEPHA
jgi:plasmid stabilization system protein ParE